MSILIFQRVHHFKCWGTPDNWPRPFFNQLKNQDRSLKVLYSFVGYQIKRLDLTNLEKKVWANRTFHSQAIIVIRFSMENACRIFAFGEFSTFVAMFGLKRNVFLYWF